MSHQSFASPHRQPTIPIQLASVQHHASVIALGSAAAIGDDAGPLPVLVLLQLEIVGLLVDDTEDGLNDENAEKEPSFCDTGDANEGGDGAWPKAGEDAATRCWWSWPVAAL